MHVHEATNDLGWLSLVPDASVVVDVRDRVIACNEAMATLAGADLRGMQLGLFLVDPRPADGAAATWRSTAHRANGVPICVELRGRPLAEAGRVISCRVVAAGTAPQDGGTLLHEAFTHAPIGMAFFNPDGEYVRVNAAMCVLMGRGEPELLGRRDQEFTHPEHRDSDVEAAWRILRGEIDTWQTEKRFVRPDGSCVWAIANMTFVRDPERRPLAWVGQFQDITERRALEERLRTLADEDPLTGLPNRRRLEQDLRRALSAAGRHGRRGAVLVLDLDGFKAINDAHGHARGDVVLAEVAARLGARVRGSDLLARLGGDEFAVLLTDADHVAAERVATDLRAALADGGCHGGIGVSIGIATFGPDEIDTAAGLLDRADRAMYRAKGALRGS